ncbi:MAG: pheA operon leader peptide PheL [Escherichia coli]|nr:pheA operon leader peptide PheL [Escherichia coli]EJA4754211.1 pheA operon leader peptide PheL [Escherichia coli]EMC2765966.1 pheA operon leader peptide PheL [Escherichia coli]MDU7604491.1 pheA operon leader peptide PheL [Escherichia coli]MDU7619425.1 pheA operon leader peptide PheL [Escherichia coli]MDU7667922.1 pheA operon leader peptide PheL [Escherichia coli]
MKHTPFFFALFFIFP